MDLLAAAVDASRCWYDGIFALHGLPAASDGRLWVAGDELPPFHSAVKTLIRGCAVDAVLDAMEPHPHGSVADSFGEFDLRPHGFELLIDATWVGHPGVTGASWPSGWTVVRDADLLARWCQLHDYAGVLPPTILRGEEFRVLARLADRVPVAGEFAGWCGFQADPGGADFGLVLRPSHWGHGRAITKRALQIGFADFALDAVLVALPYSRTPDRAMAGLGFAPDGEVSYAGARFRQYRLTREPWSTPRLGA